MSRKDYERLYINNATLTDSQRQHRAEILKSSDGKRRKLNVLGGILSAGATLYICNKFAHIDYSQSLTDTDKIIIAAVYMACLMFWRFIRQKLTTVTTQSDPYGAEERKAVAEMTPQQARQHLSELDELQEAYRSGKNNSNVIFVILVIAAAVGMCYCIKRGII